MKVEIWFDFTCPFSYIAIKSFTKALEKFTNNKDVILHLRSYNIAPYVDKTLNIDAYQYLANHKDIPYEDAKAFLNELKERFYSEGFNFNFDILIPTSSEKAHNIFKMLDDKCAKLAFINYIFKAHFEEGKDISDLEVLIEIGKNVYLKEEDIKAVFETKMYSPAVNLDYKKAESFGLTGVPAFVIDESYYLMGSHPQEAYLEMLDDFYRKAKERKEIKTEYCQGEVC